MQLAPVVLAVRPCLAEAGCLAEVPFLEGMVSQEVTAQTEETALFCSVVMLEIEAMPFSGGTLLFAVRPLAGQCSQGKNASGVPCPRT